MQRLFLIIHVLMVPIFSYGQLYVVSDYYTHDALAINPAYSGSQCALSTTISHRNSWDGIEGSPSSTLLSIHTPINNERIGLGLFMLNDKIGVSNELSIVGNYAYRINLAYGKLALGLGFGMTINNTNWGDLAAKDPEDELLAENSITGIIPDFSLGVYYSTKKYFMGFSVPLFLSHEYDAKADKYSTKNDFSEYNYFLNAGYIFNVDKSIKFFPSVLVKYHIASAPQIDINPQIIFKDKLWLGATYRSANVLAGMVQYQVNKQLRLACSYDFSLGNTGRYMNNSYEIMLNYIFNYKAAIAGPRQF